MNTKIYIVKYYRSCLWLYERYIFTVIALPIFEVCLSVIRKYLGMYQILAAMHQKNSLVRFFDALQLVNKNRSCALSTE